MKTAFSVGRILFFGAMAFFGIEHLIYATSPKHALLGPPWVPVGGTFAFVAGCILVMACIISVTNRSMRLPGILLVLVLLPRVLLVSIPAVAAQIHNGARWTSASELVAMCGGSLFVVGALPGEGDFQRWKDVLRPAMMLGSSLYGMTLVIFGVQHFIYARYVATLVPGWIPWRLFWAYFVGVAFVAAAAAILSRKNARTGTLLLGTMFFSWVILVHTPRVIAAPGDGNEWTSAFVALAMSGAAWMLVAIEAPTMPGAQQKN